MNHHPITNLLFICSRNQWRSPTAEALYRKIPGYANRSRGTSKRAVRHVSAQDLQWADLIFVMEPKHAQRLRGDHPAALTHKKIHILNIPDNYRYMTPELIEILRSSIDPILNSLQKPSQ